MPLNNFITTHEWSKWSKICSAYNIELYVSYVTRPTCVTNLTFISNELQKEESWGEPRAPRASNFRSNQHYVPLSLTHFQFFCFTCTYFAFLHYVKYVSVVCSQDIRIFVWTFSIHLVMKWIVCYPDAIPIYKSAFIVI